MKCIPCFCGLTPVVGLIIPIFFSDCDGRNNLYSETKTIKVKSGEEKKVCLESLTSSSCFDFNFISVDENNNSISYWVNGTYVNTLIGYTNEIYGYDDVIKITSSYNSDSASVVDFTFNFF
ncbi:MAG: hypothetical protein HRU03_03540 [Nanoarchaeales archaeon]|nr:hypothetical protein [Nanoarchaeales archaeon]